MDDQIIKAFNSLPKPSQSNFREVFQNHSTVFQNQLDSIRHEITICIAYDLNQAAIMLTNHLLEKFLRDVVVIEESEIKKMLPENQKKLKDAYKKRSGSTLDNLNDQALKLKIITNEQHQQIKDYVLTIRNPYSHGSSFQILKNIEPLKTLTGSLSDGMDYKVTNTQVNSFPPLQDFFQQLQAKEDAIKYFKFVDSILFSFYEEKNGGTYKRQF